VLNLNTASSAVEVAQCLEDVDCDEVVLVSDARFQSKVNIALAEDGSALRGSGGVTSWVLWANGEGGIESSSRLSVRSGRLEDVLEGPHKAVIEPGEEPEGNAPFACYWTSGTTGRSKCVVLTHKMVAMHAVTAAVEMGLNGTDVWAHVRHSAHSVSWVRSEGVLTSGAVAQAAPCFHPVDAFAIYAVTWVGGTHAAMPRFEAGRLLQMIERLSGCHCFSEGTHEGVTRCTHLAGSV